MDGSGGSFEGNKGTWVDAGVVAVVVQILSRKRN